MDEENIFKVERILDCRKRKRRKEYLIKWDGYTK